MSYKRNGTYLEINVVKILLSFFSRLIQILVSLEFFYILALKVKIRSIAKIFPVGCIGLLVILIAKFPAKYLNISQGKQS